MKSPEELSRRLATQWERADLRETRLLDGENAWPISLSIGKPAPHMLTTDLGAVRRHIDRWRIIDIGEVVWSSITYRAASEPIDIPLHWRIRDPNGWVAACNKPNLRTEFNALHSLLSQTSSDFHPLLIRRRSLWNRLAVNEVVQATRLAEQLEPGCAEGKPLRMLSLANIDTKFFERNSGLVTALLDVKHDGEASHLGLETFLGACRENDHWLLLADLDGSLLPFRQQRVRANELAEASLSPSHLVVVENERCLHQLPPLPGTLAILGAGNNLSWLRAPWASRTKVIYWGDLDTWGLNMLATARRHIPTLRAFLMQRGVFDSYQKHAVPEPVVANLKPPDGLLPEEAQLYIHLSNLEHGRLEQEFIPHQLVRDQLEQIIRGQPKE